MTGSALAWTCVAVWAAAAAVLVTTGIDGMVLALAALGCGGYRAHAAGLAVRRTRR